MEEDVVQEAEKVVQEEEAELIAIVMMNQNMKEEIVQEAEEVVQEEEEEEVIAIMMMINIKLFMININFQINIK